MVILFMGDSIYWEMYQSLVHLLGGKVYKEVHLKSIYEKGTPIMINVCGNNNVTLIYRWSKQFTDRVTSISIKQMFEERFPTMVILNTGAHYQSDSAFSSNVKQALHQMKEWQELCKNLTCPLFWQTSTPGIPYCKTFTKPVNDIHKMELHVAFNPMYHWDEFKHENEIALQILNVSQVAYQIIDAYEVGIQRPELHVSEGDCLHSYDLAVSDALNIILLHYLHATRTAEDVSNMINYQYSFDRLTNVRQDGKDLLNSDQKF